MLAVVEREAQHQNFLLINAKYHDETVMRDSPDCNIHYICNCRHPFEHLLLCWENDPPYNSLADAYQEKVCGGLALSAQYNAFNWLSPLVQRDNTHE